MSVKLIQSLDNLKKLPEITLGHIVEELGNESLLILSLISIMPFMQPIPIPGLSTVLGLVVFMQAIGLVFTNRPILSQKMRKTSISPSTFEMIYKASIRFTNITSKISMFKHPITQTIFLRKICGFSILISSAFLSLPLPIPFSNFIPAISIFLICLGLLEDDLAFILFGFTINLAVIWMAIFSYHLIIELLHSWF